MKRLVLAILMMAVLAFTVACNSGNNKQTSTTEKGEGSKTVAANTDNDRKFDDDHINDQLKAAKLDDVHVDVSNDQKIVKLTGNVRSEAEKQQAEKIAKADAESAGYIVANEIGVEPKGDKTADNRADNRDDNIKDRWDAIVKQNNWDKQHVKANVNNGVLTLKGDVDTQGQRTAMEKAAAKIPNVQQVVNELAVKSADK